MHDFAMVCWVIVIVAAAAFMLLWVGAILFAIAVKRVKAVGVESHDLRHSPGAW